MSKHTPGPWRVNFTHSKNGVLVSICIHSSDGPVPATFDNAYLMAAAPQMLEALKAFVGLESDARLMEARYGIEMDEDAIRAFKLMNAA
ncbi:MAG: hypothetical protein FGM22_07450, partial [Burkholderiaceae bacterium]|nr:hypothetical protein [Burkholderiaceae bacterium]